MLGACGSSEGGGAGGEGGAGGAAGAGGMAPFDCREPEPVHCPETPPDTIDIERPAQVTVPSDYTTSTRYPLVIALHARDAVPQASAAYLGAPQRVDDREFVLILPSGTPDTEGRLAWATEAGDSEFTPVAPNDIGYVARLIEEARDTYRIDQGRVYLMGSSDGAFLALDIVCDDPSRVTAILAQAGALPADSSCATDPVSVLSVHGTADVEVPFGGGMLASGKTIMATVNLTAGFAERSGCGLFAMPANIDLVPTPAGAETRVRSYSPCDEEVEVELWIVQEAPHTPDFTDDARELWFDWIFARARPN